jgi:16S rRNA (adenine(1408)-N(1))-methyltransferase
MGTGDGLFVLRSARSNPNKFYIGVDANARPLEKASEKIYRKARKGGLPNALD